MDDSYSVDSPSSADVSEKLDSAASATAWGDESTGMDALLGLVTLSVAIILHFG